ncbi:MAG: polysaccharide biosynthesis/export family protein, partial [Synergistaceae bacterium]|nr:polysaccharide biosynthesis/export family protein [Synergistaceae bacterium]
MRNRCPFKLFLSGFILFIVFSLSSVSARCGYAADSAPAPDAAPVPAGSAPAGAASIEAASPVFVKTDGAPAIVPENDGSSAAVMTEITETTEIERVTQYLDELLDTPGVLENRVGNLLRGIPRYGMSFFRRPPSTYAPVTRVPVTAGYVLGPGDHLVINLWGMVEESFEVSVNRDGIANVPHIG